MHAYCNGPAGYRPIITSPGTAGYKYIVESLIGNLSELYNSKPYSIHVSDFQLLLMVQLSLLFYFSVFVLKVLKAGIAESLSQSQQQQSPSKVTVARESRRHILKLRIK